MNHEIKLVTDKTGAIGLKSLFRGMQKQYDKIELTLKPEGVLIKQLTSDKATMVDCLIEPSFFESYEYPNEFGIKKVLAVVDADTMKDAVMGIKKTGSTTMTMKMKLPDNGDAEVISCMVITDDEYDVLHVDNHSGAEPTPHLHPTVEVRIKSDEFYDMLRKITKSKYGTGHELDFVVPDEDVLEIQQPYDTAEEHFNVYGVEAEKSKLIPAEDGEYPIRQTYETLKIYYMRWFFMDIRDDELKLDVRFKHDHPILFHWNYNGMRVDVIHAPIVHRY